MKRKKGFTLIEMLVVIAIIALLVALVVPAVNSALRSARRTQSMSRLRTLGQAFIMFATDQKGRLPGGGHGTPLVRWLHMVAPYLGHESDRYHEGVGYFGNAYDPSLNALFTDPMLNGRGETASGGRFALVRYGYNNRLSFENSMLGESLFSFDQPSRRIILGTTAHQAPALPWVPFPDHPHGYASAWRKDGKPHLGFPGEGAIVTADGAVRLLDQWPPDLGFEF